MARWWECKICAAYLGEFGAECLPHREETGHVGAQLLMGDLSRTPSTTAGRAKARALFAATRKPS